MELLKRKKKKKIRKLIIDTPPPVRERWCIYAKEKPSPIMCKFKRELKYKPCNEGCPDSQENNYKMRTFDV